MNGTYSNLRVAKDTVTLDGVSYQKALVDITHRIFRWTRTFELFRKEPTNLSQDFTVSYNWYFVETGKMVRPLDIIHLEKKNIGEKLHGKTTD